MKSYPCIESTIEFPVGKYLCRLWIKEETVEYPEEYWQEKNQMGLVEDIKKLADIKEIVKYLASLGFVNAVQFKTKGFPEVGTMIYFVEF